jgi:hypothetical protein
MICSNILIFNEWTMHEGICHIRVSTATFGLGGIEPGPLSKTDPGGSLLSDVGFEVGFKNPSRKQRCLAQRPWNWHEGNSSK